MKNPKWHRDELLLTLNIYFQIDTSSFISSNSKIIELSKILNKLPLHSEELRKQDFRNPNGVAMKLSNFAAIDPKNPGKGLTSYSKLDKKTFFEFNENQIELKRISNLILEALNEDETINKLYKIEDESDVFLREGFEGEIVYKLHKLRERDGKLSESKKSEALKKNGKLKCEVCDFDFYEKYGELGKGFIECHHTKQLSSYETKQKTKIEDLALVCSNCHRMLHRNVGDMSILNLKDLINDYK